MGGAQRAAAAAVMEPNHPLSKNRVAANEPDQVPAQPHAVAAPDAEPRQLAQQQPLTEPASLQGYLVRDQPALDAQPSPVSAALQ